MRAQYPFTRASRHRHELGYKSPANHAYLAAMRRIDRRHLLPGAAAFAAALLVALLGLNAGADAPTADQAREHRRAAAARRERLPRPPRAARARRGRRGVAGRVARPRGRLAPGPHDPRARRRHGRRLAADLEPLRATSPRSRRPTGWASTSGRSATTSSTRAAPRRCGWCGARATRTSRRTRSARDGGEPILPPYRIVERAGVKVGFIGVTTTDTPYFLLSEFARQYRWTRPVRRGQPLRARAAPPGRGGDRGARPRGRLPGGRRRRRRDRRRGAPDGRRRRRGRRRAHPLAARPSRSAASWWSRPSRTASPSTGCASPSTAPAATWSPKSARVMPTRHAGIRPDPRAGRAGRELPHARRAAGRPGGRPRRPRPRQRGRRPARRGRPARLRRRRHRLPQPGQHARRPRRGPDHLRRGLRGAGLRAPRLAPAHARRRPARRDRASSPGCSSPARATSARTRSTRSRRTASSPGRAPFDRGTDREQVGTDLEALVAWLERDQPLALVASPPGAPGWPARTPRTPRTRAAAARPATIVNVLSKGNSSPAPSTKQAAVASSSRLTAAALLVGEPAAERQPEQPGQRGDQQQHAEPPSPRAARRAWRPARPPRAPSGPAGAGRAPGRRPSRRRSRPPRRRPCSAPASKRSRHSSAERDQSGGRRHEHACQPGARGQAVVEVGAPPSRTTTSPAIASAPATTPGAERARPERPHELRAPGAPRVGAQEHGGQVRAGGHRQHARPGSRRRPSSSTTRRRGALPTGTSPAAIAPAAAPRKNGTSTDASAKVAPSARASAIVAASPFSANAPPRSTIPSAASEQRDRQRRRDRAERLRERRPQHHQQKDQPDVVGLPHRRHRALDHRPDRARRARPRRRSDPRSPRRSPRRPAPRTRSARRSASRGQVGQHQDSTSSGCRPSRRSITTATAVRPT